jgi:MFS family permease
VRRPPAPSPTFYGWRIVVTLAVTQTVLWGALYYAFAVLLVPMTADLGASRAGVSGAYSVALLTSGLAAPLVGRWVDRHGGRGVMTAGAAAGAALLVAWSTVGSLPALYVVQALLGVAMAACLYEPAFAVITAWFDRDRGRALLAVTVVAGFASTIFLPLTDALTTGSGWRGALLALAALVAAVTVAPHALVLRRRPADLGLLPDGAAALARDAAVPDPVAVPWRAAVTEPAFRLLTASFVLGTVSTVAVSAHLVALLTDRGHPTAVAAAATGALGLLSVTGRIVLTAAQRRVPFTTLMAGVFAAQGVGLVLLAGTRSLAGALAFVVVYGAGFGAMTLARPILLAERYGTAAYASISGTLAAFLTTARAAAPALAGLTVTRLGSYQPMLWTLAAASALAAAGMLRLDRPPATTAPDRSTP